MMLGLAGAVMLAQSAPQGGGCFRLHGYDDCGDGDTSQEFTYCDQESCPKWIRIAEEMFECLDCTGTTGYQWCETDGKVYERLLSSFCTVPLGQCDWNELILQSCDSSYAFGWGCPCSSPNPK
jgi:hypothetical protein